MIRLMTFAGLLAVSGAASAAAATWTVDPGKSTLGFSGSQTGQPFSGTFKTFAATIDFDPADPASGHVKAVIDMASASTGDPQKDEALPGADWFDVADFPKATFEATGFKALGGNRYETAGQLTIRGMAKPVTLPFTLDIVGDTAHAKGHAELVRTAFGVGQGAWANADYVAFAVGVDLDLTATSAK